MEVIKRIRKNDTILVGGSAITITGVDKTRGLYYVKYKNSAGDESEFKVKAKVVNNKLMNSIDTIKSQLDEMVETLKQQQEELV